MLTVGNMGELLAGIQEFPQNRLDQAREAWIYGPLEPKRSATGLLLFQAELTGDAQQWSASGATAWFHSAQPGPTGSHFGQISSATTTEPSNRKGSDYALCGRASPVLRLWSQMRPLRYNFCGLMLTDGICVAAAALAGLWHTMMKKMGELLESNRIDKQTSMGYITKPISSLSCQETGSLSFDADMQNLMY